MGFPLEFDDSKGHESSVREPRYLYFLVGSDRSDQQPFENWEHPAVDGQPLGEFIDRMEWRTNKGAKLGGVLLSEDLLVPSLLGGRNSSMVGSPHLGNGFLPPLSINPRVDGVQDLGTLIQDLRSIYKP